VVDIARRADVETISPNRPTLRMASLAESASGAAAARSAAGTGLDGSGVGIACLDSGIMAAHQAFADASGASRVKKSVDMRLLSDSIAARWQSGVDSSTSMGPGSAGRQRLESTIDARGSTFQDPYGHGTVVASIAAGRSPGGGTDSTGIAPNATLFDVRVLNEAGVGETADVLAGLDWVLFHAQEYGIRVVNLSLAADSTDSYLADPLCRAVRNTAAAGIAIVVAAGNFGSAQGTVTYGTIASPGNEPAAITVGSSNAHGTADRGDDSVNFFSSRGPTRGAYVDASNVVHLDNILKPDIVAP